MSLDVEPGAVEQPAGRRHRAEAHDPRRDAGRRRAGDPGQRRQPVALAPRASEATSSAAAPSLMPEALPAVTRAAVAERGLQRGQRLRRRRPRVLVGVDDRRLAAPGAAPATGTISSASRPAACALAARSCDRSANASWSARDDAALRGDVLGGLAHRVGAVAALHPGFTNRQPSVVSCIATTRPYAVAALAMTNGARLMLSTPPATTRSASPARTARAAIATASAPEPQSRLTVLPGHRLRQPGEQQRHPRDVAVVLAGLVRAAEHTSSTADQSTDGSRSVSARERRARPGRRAGPRPARRRTARSACGRRRRGRPHGVDRLLLRRRPGCRRSCGCGRAARRPRCRRARRTETS